MHHLRPTGRPHTADTAEKRIEVCGGEPHGRQVGETPRLRRRRLFPCVLLLLLLHDMNSPRMVMVPAFT